jgi:hypothetical protein
VTSPFVLCDPLILLPPSQDEDPPATDFWVRLIEWAADRRLRLGPLAHVFLLGMLGESWPQFHPPACPAGLSRDARQAFMELLGRVADAPTGAVGRAPTMTPRYVGPRDASDALGLDSSGLALMGLLALASEVGNWAEAAAAVEFDPPPPERLPLVFEPGGALPGDGDASVAGFLLGRRIMIVGGRESAAVLAALCNRFGVSADDVTWLVSEKHQRMNRNALSVLRATDVIYCITGSVSHPDWQAAEEKCRRWGVVLHEVDKPSEIVSDLYARHHASG